MDDDGHSSESNRHRPYWEKACEDYYQRLISFGRRLANGRIYEAEDLAHETVFRALFYAPDPEEIKSPLSYMLRMMRHIWIDRWAKGHAAQTESLNELQGSGQHPTVEPDVLRILENDELRDALRIQLRRLTPREKRLFKLYLSGYNCKEIAGMLHEDARLTRSDLNALKTKVRYRLMKAMAKTKTSGQP